jgi:hypothetical protein
MPAQPERGVAVPGPVELHLTGVLEDGWVPVGGRERQQQPVALLERVAVEVEVRGDQPCHRDRRVGPQQLLDGGVHQPRFGGQPAAVLGVPGQVPEGGPDGRPGGVDTGDHQQDHRAADQLDRQLVAVDLRLDQERGEVVPGVGDMVFDLGVHEGVDVGEPLVPLVGGQVDLFQDQADDAAEGVCVLLAEAEEPDDDPHRDVPGVLEGGVEARPAVGGF